MIDTSLKNSSSGSPEQSGDSKAYIRQELPPNMQGIELRDQKTQG